MFLGRKTGALWVSACLVLATVGFAGAVEKASAQTELPAGKSAVSTPTGDELTPRLELMLRTMRIARDWHVNRPAKPELVAGAIQGLLARIDGEAEVYTRAELRRLASEGRSQHNGVGLEVRREPPMRRQPSRGYRVVSSRDGSPAALAGLKAGDLITHVDLRAAGEISYIAMTRSELTGEPGTRVRLTVEREGGMGPIELELQRSAGLGGTATLAELEKGVLAIRVAAIEASTAADVERELQTARDRLGSGLRGIVLDLRGTAGGSIAGAAALADIFLESGVLLATEARTATDAAKLQAAPGDAASGRPLVVLIDTGTAGAAEVVAAALRDNQRGRLVGLKSAGRGAVRSLRGLGRKGEKGALRIATSRLLTPAGKPIEGRGLTPDVAVEQMPADAACRSLDIADGKMPGRCLRREQAQDAQLTRALGLLDEQVAAGTGQSGTRP